MTNPVSFLSTISSFRYSSRRFICLARMLTSCVVLAIALTVASVHGVVLPERLSDRLVSSQRVDEALEVCEQLLGERLRANQIPISTFHACLFAYVKKLARELDGVELVYPRTFT
ncbi:unnamed protein product [Mesocestoides corti]|uniref:Secreted protein n=1 Tax=Mesocestoides corti TaxID=53468 RepID=A0A0R3U2C5_MESCO|nr:unnamed protein product [Mesocestoides corti]